MGTQYELVNVSKSEFISFAHMSGSKARELAGNPPQAALVTWYLLNNQGDSIHFVSDTYDEWPFVGARLDYRDEFEDVTDTWIDALIKEGILSKEGFEYQDPEDPGAFVHRLINIWMCDGPDKPRGDA